MNAAPPENKIEYIPIRLGTLRDESIATFDIYIPLSDHYVHYIKLSDAIDLVRIDRLKSKGIKKLYIPKTHESAYLKYLDEGLTQLSNPSVPVAKKAEVAHAGLVNASENMKEAVETEQGYSKTQVQIGKVMEFLLTEKSAITNVVGSVGMSQDLHQHCATVATLSLAMAHLFAVKDVNHLLELGMAAMLHDVGLMSIGFDPDLERDKLTPEQLAKYQEHPSMAKELIGPKRYVSPNVLTMIVDHEEIGDGKGYPGKKNIKKLNLLSQILNTCNNYDRFCKDRNVQLSAGIEMYMMEQAGLNDARLLQALKTLVKG